MFFPLDSSWPAPQPHQSTKLEECWRNTHTLRSAIHICCVCRRICSNPRSTAIAGLLEAMQDDTRTRYYPSRSGRQHLDEAALAELASKSGFQSCCASCSSLLQKRVSHCRTTRAVISTPLGQKVDIDCHRTVDGAAAADCLVVLQYSDSRIHRIDVSAHTFPSLVKVNRCTLTFDAVLVQLLETVSGHCNSGLTNGNLVDPLGLSAHLYRQWP